MNNLPFGTAEYKQFQHTFLASVIVGIMYPQVKVNDSIKGKWRTYSRELFFVEPMEGIFEKPIVVNRSDNKLKYIFEAGRTQVYISGDGYQNFAESVIPHAYKLKKFVTDVAGTDTATEIGIRKLDVFQIQSSNGLQLDESKIRSHFLSNDYNLLKEGKAGLNVEESKIPNMIKHQWHEDGYTLTLRTVFLQVPNSDNYRLVLDIDESFKPNSGIDMNELEDRFKEINTDLFNAFMWCVSENAKSIMINGKE